jgi:hypothetical protein
MQSPDSHGSGIGCPTCGKIKAIPIKFSVALTQEEFLAQCKEYHGDFYDYSKTVYVRKTSPVIITCPIHGDFSQKPLFHKRGVGCPTCGIEKAHNHFRATVEEFIEKSVAIHGSLYSYENSVYMGKEYPITITCKKHGDFTLDKAHHHYLGHQQGCPKCSMGGTSKQEQELAAYVTSLGFTPVLNDRTIIAPYELDIVIPELNIAIEYCGLYWHSEQRGKDRNYHLNKTESCIKAGFRCIQVFEDEWLHKTDIVKSRLAHILGKDQDNKVFARKLEIRTVPAPESRDFFNKYHVQGACGASKIYGLYNKDELVACISFGVNRFTGDGGMELIRYATSMNVVGGFSKLLKHFTRQNPLIKEVVSYSDRRWSEGNVYSHNGFVLDGVSQPSYFYVRGNDMIRQNRVLYQKHKLPEKLATFDDTKTEVQNMLLNGFYRIFDCGCHKWKLTLA